VLVIAISVTFTVAIVAIVGIVSIVSIVNVLPGWRALVATAPTLVWQVSSIQIEASVIPTLLKVCGVPYTCAIVDCNMSQPELLDMFWLAGRACRWTDLHYLLDVQRDPKHNI
jgi:hypothetical protein